ncbi:GWT1 domain-containing protein [Phthorimaea operculella]|nr:GWT1 domain-containing protein [Phthorimaea operculella]
MVLWQGSLMNSTVYKNYHESYMADNEGTNAVDVLLCIFFTVQCTLYCALKSRQNVVFEYLSIVGTLILAHTVFANHILALNVFMLVYSICEHKLLYMLRAPKQEKEKLLCKETILNSLTKKNLFPTKQIQSISCLRGLTYLITVYAILAVDFRAFRKELRKTEQYGYSLMDTGVGLFTVMSGLVHKDLQNHTLKQIIKTNLKFILVLVSLGTARFWSVKAFNYQEHVTEYGVHWNFFFTVAMCKLTSTILLYISNRPFLFSALTLASHEYILSSGVQDWVFSDAPRNNLISANKEGIFSCLGYTSLYLFAVYVKQLLCNKTLIRYNVLFRLFVDGMILWTVSIMINDNRPTSRALANSAYCTYICAVLLIILAVFYCFEVTKENYFQTPVILTVVNQNGLIYFLVANLLTGAVNLSMQTLFVPNIYAIVILNSYMIITLALMFYLKDKGIRI